MKRPRPTREIVKFAQQQPGGVIRWHEAMSIYARESPRSYRPSRPLSLNKVLKRNFSKVEGTRGYYVLSHLMYGDTEGDVLDEDLYEWERPCAA